MVAITASREKGAIAYRVECSSDLTNEEFEYYLGEIIGGICAWKKGHLLGKHQKFQRENRRKEKVRRLAVKQKIKVASVIGVFKRNIPLAGFKGM